MPFRFICLIAIGAVAAFFLFQHLNDPYKTRLPFGSADLSGVQKPLAKLPPDERALVEAYVKRSRGDVLTPDLADPDEPLTARTFKDAITLQRDWEIKMKAEAARMAALEAEREARIAPLRAALSARVLRMEVLTRNEYQARNDPAFYTRPSGYRVDTSPVFIKIIRLENLSDETIVELSGSLYVKDKEAPLRMDLCWFSHKQHPLPELLPRQNFEFSCGRHAPSQQEQDFMNRSPLDTRFKVIWEPTTVVFASGKKLEYRP